MKESAQSSRGPATWDEIRRFVNSTAGVKGMTNKQIADALSLDYLEVSQLTRLIHKAGEIDRRSRGSSSPTAYVYCVKGSA